MPILFCADPHGDWGSLLTGAFRHNPEHVVLLGDMGLTEPLLQTLHTLHDRDIKVWWIHGNHDCHDVESWSNLFLNHPDGNLNGRAVTMACRDGEMTVAGLGGHFKGRVWFPKSGNERPVYYSPDDFVANKPTETFRGGLPLFHRDTIFPSYVDSMKGLKADILVCHEAPTSIPMQKGFGAIDDLARAIGVTMVIHGHHHFDYMGTTRDGIIVRGLGRGHTMFMASRAEDA